MKLGPWAWVNTLTANVDMQAMENTRLPGAPGDRVSWSEAMTNWASMAQVLMMP